MSQVTNILHDISTPSYVSAKSISHILGVATPKEINNIRFEGYHHKYAFTDMLENICHFGKYEPYINKTPYRRCVSL